MRRWAIVLGGLVLAATSIGVLSAGGWPARDFRHGDQFQFWAGAHAIFEGASPYDLGWWKAFHAEAGSRAVSVAPQPTGGPAWTTPYPLWTLIVLSPFALLPYDLSAAAWLVAQVALIAGSVAALAAALLGGRRKDVLVLSALVLASQPAWLFVGSGNVTGFTFAALSLGLVALLGSRPYAAGILFGLLLLKPAAFAIVPLALLAHPGRRRIVAGGLTTLVVLAAAALAVRPGWIPEWLTQVAALQTSRGSNATLATFDRVVPTALAGPISIALVLAAFFVWWRFARPRFEVLFAAAVCVSLLVAPHGWTYDQLHLAVVAAVILSRLPLEGHRRGVLLAGLAALAGAVPWWLYAQAPARNGEELSALVPLLLFALLLVADHQARAAPSPLVRPVPRPAALT